MLKCMLKYNKYYDMKNSHFYLKHYGLRQGEPVMIPLIRVYTVLTDRINNDNNNKVFLYLSIVASSVSL